MFKSLAVPVSIKNLAGSLHLVSSIAVAQALFFVLTGLWPIVSIRVFQNVSASRKDFWLVKSMGLMLGIAGSIITGARSHQQTSPLISIFAIGTAAVLMAIDLVYVNWKKFSRIYFLDAVLEFCIVAAWALVLIQGNDSQLVAASNVTITVIGRK